MGMHSRRLEKISSAIREVVSLTILTGLRDPRIKNVTVISAETAADLKSAKVYISVMGDPKTEALCLKGLEHARGYLQSKVADRIQTKQTPILQFVVDQGVKKSIEVSQALHNVTFDRDDLAEHEAVTGEQVDDEQVDGDLVEGGLIGDGTGDAELPDSKNAMSAKEGGSRLTAAQQAENSGDDLRSNEEE